MSDAEVFAVDPATLDDAEELARLVNSAYRGESSRAGWTTEADFLGGQRTDPAVLRQELREQSRVILCLRRQNEGRILACVNLTRFKEGKSVGCYLGMLTVDPTLQALGLGRTLLSQAESYAARAWGASRMTLGVIHLRESLMAWYERRGYVRSGLTEPFPYGNAKAGIPLRDDLHFIMFEKSLRPPQPMKSVDGGPSAG